MDFQEDLLHERSAAERDSVAEVADAAAQQHGQRHSAALVKNLPDLIRREAGAHGVEIDLGRDRGERIALALDQDAGVATFPERTGARVAPVVGDGVVLLEQLHEGADVAHAPAELLLLSLGEMAESADAPERPALPMLLRADRAVERPDASEQHGVIKKRLRGHFEQDLVAPLRNPAHDMIEADSVLGLDSRLSHDTFLSLIIRRRTECLSLCRKSGISLVAILSTPVTKNTKLKSVLH